MCMICIQWEAERMTFAEMTSAVKESIGSKMLEEPHTSTEVVKEILEGETPTTKT